jgi:hypothetical protein
MTEVRRIVLVADDCPASSGTVPRGGRSAPTVAEIQYQMIGSAPFAWTQDDVLFESWWRRQEFPGGDPGQEAKDRARAEFLARPRPCLRASPLPMRYGWGLVFDEHDRVALCPVESERYRALAGGEGDVEVQKSFRRSRRR